MKGKILIVDDFAEYRFEYRAMLEDLYDVYLAGSMNEAKKLINDSFRLAIIDVNLDRFDRNNRDGFLLAEWIKQEFLSIKIICVSAFNDEKQNGKVYDAFSQKPIIEKSLRQLVVRLLGSS